MKEDQSILNNITQNESEASSVQKYLCNVVEGLIGVLLVIACYVFAPRDLLIEILEKSPLMKFIIAFIIVFGYRLLFLLIVGKTLGMMIFKLKYLNAKLEPLSNKEKLIAVIATKVAGINYYKAR